MQVGGTKGCHGHTLGAMGAWEAAICAMALGHGGIDACLVLRPDDGRAQA